MNRLAILAVISIWICTVVDAANHEERKYFSTIVQEALSGLESKDDKLACLNVGILKIQLMHTVSRKKTDSLESLLNGAPEKYCSSKAMTDSSKAVESLHSIASLLAEQK